MKFNKNELVNLSYSLKREILSANKRGDYCNTSIVACNTRRYHGLLAITLDRFGGDRFLMLSSLDESLIVNGKQFNLGIHCYGDIYEPRGHKYVVDFEADPVPQLTYKVGEIVFRKSILLVPDKDQVLIKMELLKSPSKATLQLKPFLAFRNIHELTHQNAQADTSYKEIPCGASFCMYKGFPTLNLQLNSTAAKFSYTHHPLWYSNITYSDEYRRGYDCIEDL
ncbi:MAG: glycogen debranching enzyme N-terminal domain-containing protein, partial [Bacteroidales bacterium]|nr:glycogen debranching enzyme N-terminal domain-containing protein [Bacteroidales bacterium]